MLQPARARRLTTIAVMLLGGCAVLQARAFSQQSAGSKWSCEVVHLPPAGGIASRLPPGVLNDGATLADAASRIPRPGASDNGCQRPPTTTALAIDPQGIWLALAGDNHEIHLRKLAAPTDESSPRLNGHEDWVRGLAFSPRGDLLASAGMDGQLILWDVASQRVQGQRIRFDEPIAGLTFSPDGRTIVTIGFRSQLRWIDVATGLTIRQQACPCVDMRALAWSPTGNRILAGGRNGVIRAWDAGTGAKIGDMTPHQQRIRAIAFSPDGKFLASGSEDRTIHVIVLESNQSFVLRTPAKVMSLVFCGPNQLASGGTDNKIRLWDLTQRRQIDKLEGHTGTVIALGYDRGTLVSASYDATCGVWREPGSVAGEAGSAGRVGARPDLRFE